MGVLDKRRIRSSAARLIEEQAYAQAVREVESGKRRDGLWGKALASTQGDINAAQAKYIKLRVQSLIDEARVSRSIDDAISRSAEELSKQRLMEQIRAEKEREKELRAQEYQRLLEKNRQDFFPSIFWFGCSLFFGTFAVVIAHETLTMEFTQWTGEMADWSMIAWPSIGSFFTLWMGFKARRLESEKQ